MRIGLPYTVVLYKDWKVVAREALFAVSYQYGSA